MCIRGDSELQIINEALNKDFPSIINKQNEPEIKISFNNSWMLQPAMWHVFREGLCHVYTSYTYKTMSFFLPTSLFKPPMLQLWASLELSPFAHVNLEQALIYSCIIPSWSSFCIINQRKEGIRKIRYFST